MSDTASARPAPVCRACGHPVSPGAAVGYERLLAAHGPARPLLSADGEAFVRALLQAARAPAAIPGPFRPLLPRWDADARRLWLGATVAKEFRQPAPRQIAVLAAFEEQGWAFHLDDPLPPEQGDDPWAAKQRLHETVHNLNRGLRPGTVRFHGDGTGEGVRWEICPAAADSDPRATLERTQSEPLHPAGTAPMMLAAG